MSEWKTDKCDDKWSQGRLPDLRIPRDSADTDNPYKLIHKLQTQLEEAEKALNQIIEEPNEMGPIADLIIDEYGVKAWRIALEYFLNKNKQGE